MILLGFSKTSRSASWFCTSMVPPVIPTIQKVLSYSSLVGCGDYDAQSGLLTARLYDFTTQWEDQSHPCLKFVHFWVRQEAFLWKFHQDALAPGPFPRSQACEALPRRSQLPDGRPHSRTVSSLQWVTTNNSKRDYKYRTLPPAEAPEARIVWWLRKRAQNPLSFLFYFFYRKTLCFCHSMHELSRLQ